MFAADSPAALGVSIPARAVRAGVASIHATDVRAFTLNKHGKTDDRPFGGGPGMVMTCQPLWDAVHAAEALDPRPATRILLTPQGQPMTQGTVEELSQLPRLLLIAGHYEGIDERVIEALAPIEVSIGDFVLSGGELAAMVLIDAVIRLLPGALGDDASTASESFGRSEGEEEGGQRLLDCPHYTKPREWMGRSVPEVLVSGDHGKVDAWRLDQRQRRTLERRPDLMRPDETGRSGPKLPRIAPKLPPE